MLLITSFDIWQSHHRSNSSDDLLATLGDRQLLPAKTHLLRRLPVHFDLAPQRVIQAIEQWQPRHIICCGMAEKRRHLEIESTAKSPQEVLHTSVDLERLTANLSHTQISHDAGNFVCNHLYYSVLKHLRQRRLTSQCLFVHVPLLTDENLSPCVHDFSSLLQELSASRPRPLVSPKFR